MTKNDRDREIIILEELLKDANALNRSNGAKRKLGKSKLIVNHAWPFVLTTGLTFGAFSALGKTPFIKDSYEASLETKIEIDSIGIEKEYQYYKRNHNKEGTISYVGRWQEREDGLYERETKKYLVNDVEKNLIMRIIKNKDIESFDDVFGTAISSKTEVKSNPTDDELSIIPYIEAVLYYEDKNEVITIVESTKSNVIWTTIWLISNLFANALLYDEIDKISKGKFRENYRKLKDKLDEIYPETDTKEYKKVLKLKKELK